MGSQLPSTDGEASQEDDIICDPILYESSEDILASTDPVSTISRLHKNGYSFNLRNSEGLTILMQAAELRLANAVLALLATDADTTLQTPYSAKYVGGWYCVEEFHPRTAAQIARQKGDKRLAVIIENYKKLLQMHLIRQHLLANSDGPQLNFAGLPLDIICVISNIMIKLLE